ncbi:MAG TPA: hypothetical protein EYH08_03475 [Pyrodictium sp.]|nr:hypothetical protein [Pyrodictium sp.]
MVSRTKLVLEPIVVASLIIVVGLMPPMLNFVKAYVELQAVTSREPIYSPSVIKQYANTMISFGIFMLTAKLVYVATQPSFLLYTYIAKLFGEAQPTLIDMLSVFLIALGAFILAL